MKAYQECGIEKYEFLATLDHKTSPPCQALDGKRFYIKDAVPGENYPPMHPNCRSTTVAAFDDDKVTKRLAKDESGKYYEVPSDMTYPEWKEVYVDSRKPGLQKAPPDGTIKGKDPLMKNLPVLAAIKTNKDLKAFAEQFIDDLGIDRSSIVVNIRKIKANGSCFFDPKTTRSTLYYREYVLNSDDTRPMEYRVKTAFHEAFHLSANGKGWDGLTAAYQVQNSWKDIEETFTESCAHYLLGRYGVTEKIAPSYAEKLVKNLPRLKQLDKYVSCATIQDFGEMAFHDRQNGGGASWQDLSNQIRKVRLERDYYASYHSYIEDNADELIDMWWRKSVEEKERQWIKKELKVAMNKKQGPLSRDERAIYYGIMSCAMQKAGIK